MEIKKRPLIVAHRGTCGGNIPCNSIEAYQIALNHGADVIELDVDISKDGVLFIQHPGMEWVHLGINDRLKNYDSDKIKQMCLLNADHTKTQYSIPTLEEALLFLKGKCIVNIDKFWENPKEITELVDRLGMADEVIIKTEAKEEYLNDVEKYAPHLPYMTIVRNKDTLTDVIKQRNINYIGAEVLFTSEEDEVCQESYIEWMHQQGFIVWSNSIVYNHLDVLAAGHNDDVSLIKDPELGWGYLTRKGFDLIQTDFVMECNLYLSQNHLFDFKD